MNSSVRDAGAAQEGQEIAREEARLRTAVARAEEFRAASRSAFDARRAQLEAELQRQVEEPVAVESFRRTSVYFIGDYPYKI
jgi:hypothetical protein